MTNFGTYDMPFNTGWIDERNEREVLIGLVAKVSAWLALLVFA